MTNDERELVEKICSNVNSPLRPQIETVVATTLALQKKLDDNYDEYLNQPMSLTVTVNTGEVIRRANPFVSEYRSTFKDYANALRDLKKLCEDVGIEEEISSLAKMKEKLNIGKR